MFRPDKCNFCRDAQITTNIYILHDIDLFSAGTKLLSQPQTDHFQLQLDHYLRSAIAIEFFFLPPFSRTVCNSIFYWIEVAINYLKSLGLWWLCELFM